MTDTARMKQRKDNAMTHESKTPAVAGHAEPTVRPVAEAERPTARLDWSLYVDCPNCGGSNDLSRSEHDPEHEIARHIFTNDWDTLNGWEVTCEHCDHEFTIERVEY